MRQSPRWAAALLLAAGCRDASPPPPSQSPSPLKPAAPAPAAGETTYVLKGIVQDVDPDKGTVVIAHEDLPGFMKAMTMPFTPRDRGNLAEIEPGDAVEGPLVVTREGGAIKDYNLLSLRVARPAAAAVLATAKPEVLRPGDPVPDFAMTTQDGRPLRLSELRGEVVVLTFIYTRCPLPDYCPAIDRKFRRLAERLGSVRGRAEHVRLLSVSFDPEHDTPEVLRAHAAQQGAKPPLWTYAVASHDELRKVVGGLGILYGPNGNTIVHSVSAAVIGPDGRLVRLESGPAGKTWDPDDLLRTILASAPGSGGGGGGR